jgi:photosystem II stability/assembly factor-like uncharacterized protein
MEKHRSALLAVLFLVVCWYLFGCGSMSGLSTGQSDVPRRARNREPLLRKFVVTANTRNGDLQIRSAEETSGEASTKAQQVGAVDGVTLTGTASYSSGILTGSVRLTSRHAQPLFDVRVVVGSISNSSVSVRNAAGTMPILGANRSYWAYGALNPNQTSAPQTWQFNVPDGIQFTFTVYVYANVWRYATADGGALCAVHYVNPSLGWAVGEGGKILVTRDGGASWGAQPCPTRVDLKGVCFVDENRGWAVGGQETVLATQNGGRTWQIQVSNPGSPLTLNTIAMTPQGSGYAAGAGGMLLSTDNWGGMWLIEDSGTSADIYSLFMLDPSTCWMVGNNVFRRTVDGFEWTAMTRPGTASADLRSVWFVDANQGFAVGAAGTIVRTTNGGSTWTKITPTGTAATTALLTSIVFPTPQTGWIAGAGGTLRVTRNGGLQATQWSVVSSPVTSDLLDLACVPGKETFGAAVGAAGVALRTTDGQTWTRGGTSTSAATWRAIEWFNVDNGWVVGTGGEMLRTSDGGRSWIRLPNGPGELWDVQFLSASTGWACGANAALLKTTNGGTNWTTVTTPASSTTLFYTLRFVDGQVGWLAGTKGAILKTANGGGAWTVVNPPVANAIYWGMDWSTNGLVGCLVGAGALIVRSGDGGTTWTKILPPSGVVDALYSVRLGQAGLGVAVGAKGLILRTTDGGMTWTKVTSGVTADLRAVDFSGPNTVWAAGLDGVVLRSTNGGVTWSAVETGSGRDLYDLHVVNADNLWVAGAAGTIRQLN